jgi:GT2 family glycosyltransferase
MTKAGSKHLTEKIDSSIDRGKKPTVSVVIVNYNGSEHLRRCLSGLVVQTMPPEEIIVVDNDSDEPPFDVVRQFPGVRLVIAKKNYGYGGACNLGLKNSVGRYVAFLNNDTLPKPDWLERIVETASSADDIAVVGCKAVQMNNGLIDSAGAIIEYPSGISYPRGYLERDTGAYDRVSEAAAIGGAAFIVQRDAYKRIRGFNSVYFLYYDEVYLCWKARIAGYRVLYTPRAVVEHFGSYGLGKRSPERFRYDARNRTVAMISLLERRNLVRYVAFELVDTVAILAGVMVYRDYFKFGVANLKGMLQSVPLYREALADRRRVQSIRTVPDKVLLALHRRQTLYSSMLRYRKTAAAGAGSLYSKDGYGSIRDGTR